MRSGLGPRVTTGAGLLVMVLAALVAARYTPFWFDPDEGCALHGRCPGPWTDAVLQAMWVLEAAGFALVLLGLVRTGLRLVTTQAPPVTRPLPAWVEAAAAALTGIVLCAVPGWFLLVGALMSVQAIVAGLCLFWLLHAAAVTALDRRMGLAIPARASALPGWLAGLVIGAVAGLAVGWWAVAVRGPLIALPVVDGAALALGVLAWRAGADTGPRAAATGAVAVLATAAVALVGLSAPVRAAEPAAPPDLAAPSRPPVPIPAPPPPAARPTPAAPPVEAAAACTAEELTWSVTGWDAAMGTRAVTVVAAGRGVHPCYVDGFAGIAIAQGGRDLRLTTQPGGQEAPQRVALAPGDTAAFSLVWKGYGAAADEDTPQELRVVLPDGGGTGTVPLGTAPAPFDLVDGGAVRVGPWRPIPPP